jgi:thiol-disulfide isomerase/thioredoxin
MITPGYLAMQTLWVVLGATPAVAPAPPPPGVTRTEPARALPELRIIDSKGRTVGPKELAGKVVVLNLWATWCGPCVHEMPSLERLQGKLGGAELAVVAVSLDREGRRAVERFFTTAGLKALEPYYDPRGRTATLLGAEDLPLTLILDRQGREVARAAGALDWSSPEMLAFLRDLIGQEPKAASKPQ